MSIASGGWIEQEAGSWKLRPAGRNTVQRGGEFPPLLGVITHCVAFSASLSGLNLPGSSLLVSRVYSMFIRETAARPVKVLTSPKI